MLDAVVVCVRPITAQTLQDFPVHPLAGVRNVDIHCLTLFPHPDQYFNGLIRDAGILGRVFHKVLDQQRRDQRVLQTVLDKIAAGQLTRKPHFLQADIFLNEPKFSRRQ